MRTANIVNQNIQYVHKRYFCYPLVGDCSQSKMSCVCHALLTRDNLGALVLDMLFHWARRQRNAGPGAVSRLVAAMVESGRRDLADEIEDTVCIGRRKYSESLKRVGLEGESSSLGENTAVDEPMLGADG